MVEGKGHDATILEAAASLGPNGAKGLTIEIAGRLRPIEWILVFLGKRFFSG